ncbi:MAG: ATP-binding cassette domain-containing protein [Chloroflexota bacterium]|mgnify:CR=1 FL=1
MVTVLHPEIETKLAVAARNVWISYSRKSPVLRGLDLEVAEGTVCMVLGPSGSGKTTLLKALKGLLRPQQGSITVLGKDIARTSTQPKEFTRQVAYIPQHLGIVHSLSVLQNTLIGTLGRTGTVPSLLGHFSQESIDEAQRVLESLGIAHKAREQAYHLSGGERQRVAIARALMQHPKLILADEFVSHLDTMRVYEIMEIVRDIANRGVTFVVTTHEIDLVSKFGDKAVYLRDGRKVHEGPASAVTLETIKRLTQ